MSTEWEIVVFQNEDQKEPFTEWVLNLDSLTRKRIFARLARLQAGNFGDCKAIDQDLFELRYFFGAGYRVYFGKENHHIVILLCGGNKSSQKKDITKARKYWSNYNELKIKKSKQL